MSSVPAPLRVVPAVRLPGGDNPLLDEWEVFGRAAGWSEQTIGCRRNALAMWQRRTGVPLEKLTARDLAHWLSTCRTPATRCTYYRHARSFFTWLQANGYREDNPAAAVSKPRQPRGAPRPVSEDALEAALAIAGRNARAYILLGAYAGLRVSEIARVRGEDLDLRAGTLRVIGKGAVEAVVPLHPLIAKVSTGWPARGYWFPSGSTRPVQRTTSRQVVGTSAIEKTIQSTFERAGYPGVTPHRMRHRFGSQVLRSSGGNLRVAQECLRHASPATTACYTLVEDAERRRAVDGLPG